MTRPILIRGAQNLNRQLQSEQLEARLLPVANRLGEALDDIEGLLDTLVVNNRHSGFDGIPVVESINVVQLFSTLRPMLEQQAKDAGKQITWRARVKEICIDRNRLLRILTNLVTNAIKYSNGHRIFSDLPASGG